MQSQYRGSAVKELVHDPITAGMPTQKIKPFKDLKTDHIKALELG